jgi:hypothetical protein
MCREIVETVHEVEGLGISESLADFLDTAVDITEIYVDFLDDFTVDRCTETEHAVSGGVLRADIDHKIFGFENTAFMFHDLTLGILGPDIGEVGLTLVFNRNGIDCRVVVIVLAQRIALPVDVEEEAAHIGIVDEDYPEEVIDFTLENGSNGPKIVN